MMETIAEPLVPAGIDLQDFPYIRLYVERLLKSRAWLICKRRPELAFYMINLWMGAWHALPASSLEDDDDVLADLARCDPLKWDAVKNDVLRGWKKCEKDGRLYHPVVAEIALDAWASKLDQRRATLKARIAKAEKRLAAVTDVLTRQEIEGQLQTMRQQLSQYLSQPLEQVLTQSEGNRASRPVADNQAGETERQQPILAPVAASAAAPATGSKRKGEGEGKREGTKETPLGPPSEGGRRASRSSRIREGEDPVPINTPEERDRNLWSQRLKQWLSTGYWGALWGPRHGEEGFQGPREFAAMSADELRASLLGDEEAA